MKNTFRIVLVGILALSIHSMARETRADTWADMGEMYVSNVDNIAGPDGTGSQTITGHYLTITVGARNAADAVEEGATVTHSWQYQSAPGVQSLGTATLTTEPFLDSIPSPKRVANS